MVWILVLHISAMLFWCAALLYLSSLIVGTAHSQTEITDAPEHHDSMARFVFTHIATPAALLAIIFGTLLFVVDLIVSSRSEEHTSELQSRGHLVCRLLLVKKNIFIRILYPYSS